MILSLYLLGGLIQARPGSGRFLQQRRVGQRREAREQQPHE